LELLIGAAEVGGDGSRVGGEDGKGGPVTRVRSGAKTKEVDLEAAGASVAEGEISPVDSSTSGVTGRRLVPVYGVNRPYFHVDVETAVAGAIRGLERRG
jgi:sodium-independent sulfate anion transporter 11